MKKIIISLFLFLFIGHITVAQNLAERPHTLDTTFDKTVDKLIDYSVPVIGVEELKQLQTEFFLFDTREKEEYEVSHIEGAKYLGHKDFDIERLGDLPKDCKIIVYCSVGYRSEKIGEELMLLGYTNVFNLYGSIFDWVNRGNPVVDKEGKVTPKVHTYNWAWSKWVDQSQAERVW